MPVYQNTAAIPRQELTDFVMEAANASEQFIGLQVLPPSPMQAILGHYPKIQIQQGELMRGSSRRRDPGANFTRITATIGDDTINLIGDGFEVQVPDEVELTYEEYLSVEQLYSKQALENKMRQHEMDVAATVQNTANFDSVNSSVAYITANSATIDLIGDIVTAIRRVKARGEAPNTVVIPGPIFDVVRQAALVKGYIAGVSFAGALVTAQTLQKALGDYGITSVLIADAYVNTANKTAANPVMNPIWSTSYVWVGDVREGALQTGGAGRTMFWEKLGPLFFIETYREEPKKSNIIRAYAIKDQKITNSRAGTLIATQA